MTVRVAINGFGRIGRNVFRAAKTAGADIDFVAVNDLGEPKTMAHLLKYDSVYGQAPFAVEFANDEILVDGDKLDVLSVRNPSELPWGDLGVDVVVESTGIFKNRDGAQQHLDAGAQRVAVSAPGKNLDAMLVLGVNDDAFDASTHQLVSNASCTTNCFAHMVKVLDDAFGVEEGFLTTVHAYTGTQNMVDAPHKDLRRTRAGAINLIPTSTGSATATGRVLTHMEGKLDGIAVRVPVPAGSLTDFVGNLKNNATIDEINEAFRAAASTGVQSKYLGYTEDPIVSSDIVGRAESCIHDAGVTLSMGSLVKIAGWYDNEWGYSNRMVDLVELLGAAAQA